MYVFNTRWPRNNQRLHSANLSGRHWLTFKMIYLFKRNLANRVEIHQSYGNTLDNSVRTHSDMRFLELLSSRRVSLDLFLLSTFFLHKISASSHELTFSETFIRSDSTIRAFTTRETHCLFKSTRVTTLATRSGWKNVMLSTKTRIKLESSNGITTQKLVKSQA